MTPSRSPVAFKLFAMFAATSCAWFALSTHALDGVVQSTVGKRVGDKFVRTQLEELVQHDRADFFGDDQNLNFLRAGAADQIGDDVDLAFVLLVDSQCNEFQSVGFRLIEEGRQHLQAKDRPSSRRIHFPYLRSEDRSSAHPDLRYMR